MARSTKHLIDILEARLAGYVLPLAPDEAERTWLDLVREVARAEGVDYRDVLSPLRSRSVVRARHRVWQRLADSYSANEIATRWGADHTSVGAALNKLREAA